VSDLPAGRRPRRQERLDRILGLLSVGGEVTVADLAAQLSVSSASVRRDLELLEQQRLLVRTHGGAVAQAVSYELPLRYRSGRREHQKRLIADEAASRVQGERVTVALTGGTTTTEVARVLSRRDQLTVVTNALNIASELVVRPSVKLLVTGGVAREQSYELCGPIAEASLMGVNLDFAFVGVDGLTQQAGLTTHHEVEAHTNHVMLRQARHVVVVADSTKIGRVAFARICAADEVDELVTDDGADPDEVSRLRDAGLRVTVVAT
jgi:DeoR family transcriptional regulator, aga operon transcriptional repressor